MLQSERHKIQNQPNAIQAVMALRRNHRSITQQKQQTSHLKKQNQERLLSLMQKSKDFSSIFSKHKRSQYSGYKQVNMNKSKIIKFQNEHKEISRYQTPRKYQMNLKNIAKLRKRYSLEPSHFRQSSRSYKIYFNETLKPLEPVDDKPLQICSDRKCEKQLKEIIKQIKTSKYFSANNYHQYNQKYENYSSQRQSKRISTVIQSSYDQQYSSLHLSDKIKEVNNKNHLKLSALKIKKGKKIEFKNNFEIKLNICQPIINQQEENLCGWESQSFYPKKKFDFFEGFKRQTKNE